MRKALLGAPHYVQEWIHLYDAGNIEPETRTNSDTCQWEPFLVIQVQALNMHGNNKGFTGPYSLSYTVAAVPWGKRWGKEQSHMGNRIAWQSEGSWIISHFTLCNTFAGVAAHKVTGAGVKASYTNTSNLLLPLPQCSSLFIFTLPYTHTHHSRTRNTDTQPVLPSFINVCFTAWHWWLLFTHTVRSECLCVSPCAGLLLYWCHH